jgi:hypothetical protein
MNALVVNPGLSYRAPESGVHHATLKSVIIEA